MIVEHKWKWKHRKSAELLEYVRCHRIVCTFGIRFTRFDIHIDDLTEKGIYVLCWCFSPCSIVTFRNSVENEQSEIRWVPANQSLSAMKVSNEASPVATQPKEPGAREIRACVANGVRHWPAQEPFGICSLRCH